MRTRNRLLRRFVARAAFALLLGILTFAAGLPAVASAPMAQPLNATSATSPSGDITMPTNQPLDKVSEVFQQLVAILQTQGADAARRYAVDQGLMTTQDEVRVTVVLDTDDQAVVDQTAIALGRLGARVTSSFDDTIELVVPVQTIIDAAAQVAPGFSAQLPFFQPLAEFQHVQSIRRTPVARPAANMQSGL
jgi:hypothetical protein